MIDLAYQNGAVLVYKVEDWLFLREKYRIIGEFFGSTQYVPVLPLKLYPEEAALLLNKNVVRLLKYDKSSDDCLDDELKEKLLEEEIKIYKNIRRSKIECYIDKIVEGKHKKGDNRSREEIMEEELQKSVDINEKNMLWPILLESLSKENAVIMPKEEFLSKLDLNKCLIYQDLWEKGYFITAATKFGGEFLAYLGDPLMYHAMYIIKYLPNKDVSIFTTELIAFGRLGTSVKKKSVLATVEDNTVKYITINWIEV